MKKIYYLVLLSTILFACKKDENNPQLSGDYTGTFRTLVQGKLVMTDFDVSLTGDQFKVTKGSKMGSGSYETGSNNQVVFKDKNLWTADFNWNVILTGNYTFKVTGDSLILSKNLKPGGPLELIEYNYYEYRLKRSK